MDNFKPREKLYRVRDGKVLHYLENGVDVLFDMIDYKISFGSMFHDDYDVGSYTGKDYIITERTGATDKNGTKIFEGDILYDDMNDRYQVVSYGEQMEDGIIYMGYETIMSWFRFVGNVFENKDLLD